MATYAELSAEPWWKAEAAPDNLRALYAGFGAWLNRPDAVGGKGDNLHLRGYHRSRDWILGSKFSLYGKADYSIQHELDKGGEGHWLSAMDATPWKTETLIEVCQRLAPAVKAGRFPQIREWYGNVDGDKVVDGWDAVAKRAATSDSSHLWHLHISFFRSRADWDHTELLAVLTGEDMTTLDDTFDRGDGGRTSYANGIRDTVWALRRLEPMIAGLTTPQVDAGAVAAALASDTAFLAALAKAVNDDAAARLAE